MKDLFFLAFIAFVLLLGLRRPFLWVLLYVYIDILAPQRIGYSIITILPLSLIAFAAAFGGWFALDRKEGARFTLRQGLMLALLVYCWWTTGRADFPEDALTKWDWVWKALLFAIFLPLTLTTRARIEGLALVLLLSVATIVIATGLKVVLGGGGYGELNFFVDDNSGIYESSTLATVAIGLIPLLWWFVKHGTIFRPHWTVTAFAVCLTFACLLVPIGTEARTGLLCIAALAVLMLRHTKRRFLFIAGAGMLGLVALPFLPQSYYDRMATIAQPGGDESASTRVAVWKWTLDYVESKPLGGGFDAYRSNRFTYTMPVKKTEGATTTVTYQEVEDKARAYHSSIFEMLGEQGWPGLGIWLLLHALGLWQMERIQRRWKRAGNEAERWIGPLAGALPMGAII
jgi:probable O-glycosylation ligase (exosortase A-associated)